MARCAVVRCTVSAVPRTWSAAHTWRPACASGWESSHPPWPEAVSASTHAANTDRERRGQRLTNTSMYDKDRTCMHTCGRTHTHTDTNTTQTHTLTHRHKHTHTHTYTCACTHTHTCTHAAHKHTCTHKYKHACMCTHT